MNGAGVEVSFTRLGDAALAVGTPGARALLESLRHSPLPGVEEVVPALHLLTLLFDPLRLEAAELEAALRARLEALDLTAPAQAGTVRTLVVPVRFGGEVGQCFSKCKKRRFP